jgi:pilus assembly protein CpaC
MRSLRGPCGLACEPQTGRRQEDVMRRAGHKAVWILVLALGGSLVAGSHAAVWAQASALPVAAAAAAETDASAVRLLVGRSTVLDVGKEIARVSLTSADIADALVTSPHQLLINGKMPGTISMFVWDRGGALRRYEVIVQRDLARLAEQMRELFPNEKIDVQANGRNVVLSGLVTSKDAIERAVNVAAGYVDKREEVVTLLQLQPNAPSNQVLLRVRFAEVSRSALTELGASFFTSPTGVENTIGRITTQQFPSPGFDNLQWTKESGEFGAPVTSASGEFTFGDFLNFFLFNQKYDLGLMVRALQSRGLFQSLAEPNLVAESGKEASFLAGGEFPIPIAQGSGAALAISVTFKEFGIRLNFTPTVTEGGRVHLKVKPEVSTLDFANGVLLNGFRIPALTTRRTETELELADGQTFAIAGLLSNSVASTLQKVPGIGDIPILGYLFRSKAAQKNQTELVVLITPVILPNNSRGVTPNLPRMQEPFLPPVPDRRAVPPPPPAFGATAPAVAPVAAAQTPRVQQANERVASTDAAAAAAAVSALTPSAPRVLEAGNGPVAPVAAPVAPVTEAEKRARARARRDEAKRAEEQARADRRAAEVEAKRQAELEREAQKERERQEKLAREQAKRDAEAARVAAEQARRQAEIDARHQKAVEEAAAKLKAAEAAYQQELAKKNNP